MKHEGIEAISESPGEDFYGGIQSLCPAPWVNDLAETQHAPENGNRLAGLRPTAVACVRYATDDELASVIRNQLRQQRLFLRSSSPRPPGTEVMVQLQAPSLLDAVELHGIVEKIITPGDALATGGSPGMSLRIASLNEELFAELERSSQATAG